MKMKENETVHFQRKSECSLFPIIPRHNSMSSLTLYLLTWRIWWTSNKASKGKMGFNLAFKGL